MLAPTEFYELTKKFIYFSIVKIVDDFSIDHADDILRGSLSTAENDLASIF